MVFFLLMASMLCNTTYWYINIVEIGSVVVCVMRQDETCRYTLSCPTWIGPGGNVTCTLLKEGVAD